MCVRLCAVGNRRSESGRFVVKNIEMRSILCCVESCVFICMYMCDVIDSLIRYRLFRLTLCMTESDFYMIKIIRLDRAIVAKFIRSFLSSYLLRLFPTGRNWFSWTSDDRLVSRPCEINARKLRLCHTCICIFVRFHTHTRSRSISFEHFNF